MAWCRGPAGLALVDVDGAVVDDSETEGLPEMRVERVATTGATAWVRGTSGEGRQLLRFDAAAVLAPQRP